MLVARVFRPDPPDEAGAAEVLGVMDAIAADWPGSPARLPGVDPVASYFMALDHPTVMWDEGPDGRLKVIAGATTLGTVVAVALQGTAEWVDSEEANGILGSYLQQ